MTWIKTDGRYKSSCGRFNISYIPRGLTAHKPYLVWDRRDESWTVWETSLVLAKEVCERRLGHGRSQP